jgi:hypothetical protein
MIEHIDNALGIILVVFMSGIQIKYSLYLIDGQNR